MDHHRTVAPASSPAHAGPRLLLGAALLAVAVLTLTPQGTGWTWGAPAAELRWYATGLGSGPTVTQLLGNLGLLALPAALLVAAWPAAGRSYRLVGLALGTAAAIEAFQWLLPLGRVVSPVDALLNAAGAVAAGLLVRRLRPAPVTGAGPGIRPASPRRCAPRPAAAPPGRRPAPSPG